MARLARVVIPGLPHHVTQRGNRREPVFFGEDDYRAYLDLVSAAAQRSGTAIWAYCLMPNHVHFIMVPADPDGLRRTFAEAHRRYTGRIHARQKWTGHLWQGRFSSTAMDESHLIAAARYVPMNPVRAGLVVDAQDWPWSSATAHLTGRDDGVVTVAPLLDRIDDFAALLAADEDEAAVTAIRRSRSTGRPVGSADWIRILEADTKRPLAPAKPARSRRPIQPKARRIYFIRRDPDLGLVVNGAPRPWEGDLRRPSGCLLEIRGSGPRSSRLGQPPLLPQPTRGHSQEERHSRPARPARSQCKPAGKKNILPTGTNHAHSHLVRGRWSASGTRPGGGENRGIRTGLAMTQAVLRLVGRDDADKRRALEAALSQIDKAFGKGSVMKLGEKGKIVEIESVSTGSLGLDLALGIGGLPKGRIVEIYGPESSGKTTLALHVVAEVQKAGGTAAFVDAEHALDPSYAHKLGVNLDDLLVSQPDTGEQALEITDTLVRSGAVDIIVIDSVAALTPRAEIEGEMGDSLPGLQARLMSQALRKLTASISKAKTLVIFINQIRMKIGVMYGSPETTTGGNALKFYASVRLDIRRIGSVKQRDEIIGNNVRVKVVKNKVAPPFREVEFDIMYGQGISKLGEIIDLGVKAGVVEKSGSWFSYNSQRIGQGRDNAREFLKANPDMAAEIEKAVRGKADVIEEELLVGGPSDEVE